MISPGLMPIDSEEGEATQKGDRAHSRSSGEYIPAKILLCLTETVFCTSHFNGCSMPAEIRASLG